MKGLGLGYVGLSQLLTSGSGQVLTLSPNLLRDPVSFDAEILQPLLIREALSALHDVVVQNLRRPPKDRKAYLRYKKEEAQRELDLRLDATARSRSEAQVPQEVPRDFERQFEAARKRYWSLRDRWSRDLLASDPATWRRLVPCDPIVTVAPDGVIFEGFSSDESAWGCAWVQKEGFGPSSGTRYGTTNVDYSPLLHRTLDGLRTYRTTRLRLDPGGVEVATVGNPSYREETIPLPRSWLTGYYRLCAALTLPSTTVTLTRDSVSALLGYLRRHRAHTSPRALRFELVPGAPVRIVVEPWSVPIPVHGEAWNGPPMEPIRIWGRDRLQVLTRVLPAARRITVHLLGTGLPSIWVVDCGPLQFTLALSGWTVNDWSRGSALGPLAPFQGTSTAKIDAVAEALRSQKRATASELAQATGQTVPEVALAGQRLALMGQVFLDPAAGAYRWRQVLPPAVGATFRVPDEPERDAAWRLIMDQGGFDPAITEVGAMRRVAGRLDGLDVELLSDADGHVRRGRCGCAHFRSAGLKRGPCRHLLVLSLLTHPGARVHRGPGPDSTRTP